MHSMEYYKTRKIKFHCDGEELYRIFSFRNAILVQLQQNM
jgi:hypothetical protein